MLEQIKRKRLSLTTELPPRPRVSSTEKRKKIEASLEDFKKGLNSRPGSSSKSDGNKKLLHQTPTMKDLKIEAQKSQQSGENQEQVESPRFGSQDAQFHGEIDKKAEVIDPITELATVQEVQKKEETEQKQSDLEVLEEVPKQFQPTYQLPKEQVDGLNFNYNQSHYGESSNNSSAIFFTSQFREYINRDNKNEQQKPQQIQPITLALPLEEQMRHSLESDKEIGESFLKIGEQDISEENQKSKRLNHNESGRSLALSNNDESTLKYSRANESAVNYILNRKLDEELVLEIGHFSRNSLLDLVNKVVDADHRQNVNNLIQLLKICRFMKRRALRAKRYYLDGFIIYNEYKYEIKKNQMKADAFQAKATEALIKAVFYEWRAIMETNDAKCVGFQLKTKNKLKNNVFRVFRMIWYDGKVTKQADLYYLSKIFTALKVTAAKSKKQSQILALKFYCRNLKKVFFNKLIEGVESARREREAVEISEDHYRYTLMRKFFDSWLAGCSKQVQYISLTMTSKNAFKQTADHRWLQTRTVDFKQLK